MSHRIWPICCLGPVLLLVHVQLVFKMIKIFITIIHDSFAIWRSDWPCIRRFLANEVSIWPSTLIVIQRFNLQIDVIVYTQAKLTLVEVSQALALLHRLHGSQHCL